MEIAEQRKNWNSKILFKIDLIVWKYKVVSEKIRRKLLFKIDLIVWKYSYNVQLRTDRQSLK